MNTQNLWYLDTEFIEDGKTIELVSIGLVSFDGLTEYYAISLDWVHGDNAGDEWFQKNVTTKLFLYVATATSPQLKPRCEIAADLLELFGITGGVATRGQPEIWADYASYDWVALCQLYGRMMDLPAGMPMFCMDLQQHLTTYGIRRAELPVQKPETEHNALGDARHLRACHRFAFGLNWD